MKVDIKEKKQEAIKRLRLLKILPQAVRDFEKNDLLYYSEFHGVLYWAYQNEDIIKAVRGFEQKYNSLVYHAQLSNTEFGRLLSLFYVSEHKEEWGRDISDLKQGYAFCYVVNLDDWCSEFGSIGFRSLFGGVQRVA